MARKGCHCKACNEGTTQSCSIEKLLYIYMSIGCKKFGRPGFTRVWTCLLSDIRYRFMTGVSTSLLCVCVLPTSQRPDLPVQSCSTTFLGSSIDSDVIQRCCKESQIEHIQWCILPGGLPSQIRRTPSVRTADLCRVTECVGRKDLKRQSIAYLCVLFPF